MSHAFVSYVRENRNDVDRMCAELYRFGVRTWVDRSSLTAGQSWPTAVRRAIRDGAAFLACFSPEFQRRSRTYMHEELALALGELRRRPFDATWFIPVLLGDCEIPDMHTRPGETLRDIQRVDLYRDWADGIRRILQAISELPGESLDFDRVERIDRLVEALEILHDNVENLWGYELSAPALDSYRQALVETMRQLTRAAVALNPSEVKEIEQLLSRSFNFRVGKQRLLQLRAREQVHPDEIEWQIEQNRLDRDRFNQLLSRMRERQADRPL